MMSKEKRRVPKLRFPGFTEDWEQRKLTDIAKTFIGLVTTMTENYRDSGTLLIRNSDIKEGQFIFSEKPIHLDEEFAEKNKTRRLQIGDVVTVHTGDIGTSAVIQEKEAGAIGFATINTRTDKRILNPYFLSTYFNTEKHKCYANSVSTGDGRSNYNIKDFNKLVISIPTLDEQEKISVLINNINTIITLHQRKLDNLKLKKKALLQKLFPKNGERYPELRFPGFTDAWEQRKLGAMCSLFTDGDWIESKDQSNEGIRLIQTGNIGVGKFIDKPENKKWISHSTFNNLRCKKLLDGDILISRLPQPAGRACIVNTNNEKWITAVDCTIVRLLDQYSNKFILQSLCTYSYFHLIDSFLAGGTRQRVSRSNLSDINIMSPEKIEQDKIGLFFECVDNLITLHQRKLDHLKLQKKALLQQMFV